LADFITTTSGWVFGTHSCNYAEQIHHHGIALSIGTMVAPELAAPMASAAAANTNAMRFFVEAGGKGRKPVVTYAECGAYAARNKGGG
jgi:hypothetical protein